jgi:hypothetical protein
MSQQATINGSTSDDVGTTEQATNTRLDAKDDALPLPKWLTRIYYIFPIVLYVPDMLFNFYVYSDGLVNVKFPDVLLNIQFYLWAFLACGIVGMAWLLSVLAPWHWVRGHKFQSVMCWIGVVIATAITTWSSLAYRSLNFKAFETDKWITQTFHINISSFSPTMILVAVAPPFWGLFWAIVQPAERRRSASEERETHLMKLERLKQEAEIKRLRAEANAQIREAQLKGLAASMKAARAQIGAALTNKEASATPEVTVTPETTSDSIPAARVVALPPGNIRRLSERRTGFGEETSDSGEHEVLRGTAANMSYSVAAPARDDVFQAPDSSDSRPRQGMLPLDESGSATQENETILSTSRPGMPRASTLLRNYAEGEHVMREVDSHVEQMRAKGMKVTIKTFAEYRGIELSLSKQLLAKWREWKQGQQNEQRLNEASS